MSITLDQTNEVQELRVDDDEVSINVNVTFLEVENNSKASADNDLLLLTVQSLATDGTLRRRMAVGQLISGTSARPGVGQPLVEVEEIDKSLTLAGASTLQWTPLEGLKDVLVAALASRGAL